MFKSNVAIAVLGLCLSVGVNANAAQSTGRITSYYLGQGGSVGFWMSAPVTHPGAPCAVSGFNNGYIIFNPDYSTTARTEWSKQMISTLFGAFLAGKTITVYSQPNACTGGFWGGTVATLWDVQVGN